MEANEFIAKLKAETTGEDAKVIDKVYESYKAILSNLAAKDRSLFSLNVLCTLCRNLDKAPTWREQVDCRILLNLSIDCVRETRAMAANDRVKTLACIYHIHRHVIRQTKHVPPELILKISFMPFETDTKHLLKEYSKTYWNILLDRMCFIEKLNHIPISKLLPKLTEDLIKTIEIYDTVQFCSTILVFLVKKLHFLYTNSSADELNKTYVEIFKKIASKDLKSFKNLTKEEILNVYEKLNECLYVIVENISKVNFKKFVFDKIVLNCMIILENSPDFFHCFQTFYVNCFNYLFTSEDVTDRQTRLKYLLLSIEATERLGYKTALKAIYPFINNFLRVYIENNITNISTKPWQSYFEIQTQEITLKILLILMRKLKNCKQLLKCENCRIQTGLHDSLRTSFLLKNFINLNLSQKLLITDLKSLIFDIINEQNKILNELKELGCSNYKKCFRKNQTDVHNCAISLHKAKYYEFSIELFDKCIESELKETIYDHKNISRALYNKSICDLDSSFYKNALIDAFLSLIFSKNDGLNSEKYMSLVMDIKSKESKARPENQNGEINDLQMFSVLDATKYVLDNNVYGDLKEYLKDLQFEVLLRHEYNMYAKLWPSIAPIGGVWKSLYELYTGVHDHWINVDKEAILWCLFEIIIETVSVVRTIHTEYYETTVNKLLIQIQNFENSPNLNIIRTALMFLNTEYSLAASSKKYGWKPNELIQTTDPDQIPANRTLPQEHAAIVQAIKALDILTGLVKNLDKVTKTSLLRSTLAIYQVFVYQFLHLSKTVQGLQLAYICCLIADYLDDVPTYIINAGNLLYHIATPGDEIKDIITKCGEKWKKLSEKDHFEIIVIFICNAAIYYSKCGSIGLAARLVQSAQAKTLNAYKNDQGINVEMAMGRVMEAQLQVCNQSDITTDRLTVITAVNAVQRHYLSISSIGSTWSSRRSFTLRLHYHTGVATLGAARGTRKVLLMRRAGAAGAAGLGAAGAGYRARIYGEVTDVHCTDDAQIKIDNRLKHILGIQPTNEIQTNITEKERQLPNRRTIEPMRDIFTKNQTSPSLPCIRIPTFNHPEFIYHDDCDCCSCVEPLVLLLACKTAGLEAAVYFRAGEIDIARSYFNGAIELIELSRNRLSKMKEKLGRFEKFIVADVLDGFLKGLKEIEAEILLEFSFLELKCQNYDSVDENIVGIYEIFKEFDADVFLRNEVLNLIVASADLRKVKKCNNIENLEDDFEKLEISTKDVPKTPEIKVKIPKEATKKVVKDEEIYKKRKVIKLNLDEENDDFEAPKVKVASAFKVPVPKLTKATLELATPVTTRSVPKLLITQPSQETPVSKKNCEFFTPNETPEQFFTPMTSVKTYTKKNLRQNIVKKLEDEFSTPKQIKPKTDSDSEYLKLPKKTKKVVKNQNENQKPNVNADLKTKTKKKETLRRATSPGKLPKVANPTGKATSPGKSQNPAGRSSRRRPRAEFSLDDDQNDAK